MRIDLVAATFTPRSPRRHKCGRGQAQNTDSEGASAGNIKGAEPADHKKGRKGRIRGKSKNLHVINTGNQQHAPTPRPRALTASTSSRDAATRSRSRVGLVIHGVASISTERWSITFSTANMHAERPDIREDAISCTRSKMEKERIYFELIGVTKAVIRTCLHNNTKNPDPRGNHWNVLFLDNKDTIFAYWHIYPSSGSTWEVDNKQRITPDDATVYKNTTATESKMIKGYEPYKFTNMYLPFPDKGARAPADHKTVRPAKDSKGRSRSAHVQGADNIELDVSIMKIQQEIRCTPELTRKLRGKSNQII